MQVPDGCGDEEATEFICKPAANALKADLDECDVNEKKDRLEMVLEFKNLHAASKIANWDKTIPKITNGAKDLCKNIRSIHVFKIVESEKDEDSSDSDDGRRILNTWSSKVPKTEFVELLSI